MPWKRIQKLDPRIPSLDEVEKLVDEPDGICYAIFKPDGDRRRILVLRGPNGGRLKQPIESWIPARLRDEDAYLTDFMVRSLCEHVPSLIPLALENESVRRLCRYLLLYRSGSSKTLWLYVSAVKNFSKYLGRSPDELIMEASESPETLSRHMKALEEHLLLLKSRGVSPSYIELHLKGLKAFYRSNGLELGIKIPIRNDPKYYYRAPTPDEIQRILEYADLREKAIISMLALGGFRLSTLVHLRYRHVKHDLEAGIIPVHIHVEAEITKGKYASYDTFIGNEAVEYLKLYLEQRRRRGEIISDDSPLIAAKRPPFKPLTEQQVYLLLHRLYAKAGVLRECHGSYPSKFGKRYDLRVHSLRKFFRTQLTARGVPAEYVEYMMGHKTSRYNDIKSLGVEFLRNLYKLADLSIRPKPLTREQIIKIFEQALKDIARRTGIALLEEEGEIEPAAYIKAEEPSPDLEKLSLELETILKHMMARMLERSEAVKPYQKIEAMGR